MGNLRLVLFQKVMDMLVFLTTHVDYGLIPIGTIVEGHEVMGICKQNKPGGLVVAKLGTPDFDPQKSKDLIELLHHSLLEALEPMGIFDDGTYTYAALNGTGEDTLIILTLASGQTLMWSAAGHDFFLKTT